MSVCELTDTCSFTRSEADIAAFSSDEVLICGQEKMINSFTTVELMRYFAQNQHCLATRSASWCKLQLQTDLMANTV